MPALYPVFEEDVPSAENFDGMGLSTHLEDIDRISVLLRLTSLASLIDARTMALQVLDEDQLPANCPPVRWHSPKDALVTVQGLLSYLEEHPERLPERMPVMPDLKRLAALLQEANTRNIKFHLLIDL